MAANRVVQGRMVTPESLAELVEGEKIIEAESITEADMGCEDCGGSVLEVTYMPTISEIVVGQKCQDCDWSETVRQ